MKLILANYGFAVSDLGKGRSAEQKSRKKPSVSMPRCRLKCAYDNNGSRNGRDHKTLRVKAPWAKVCVGGAVLTQEYADAIGADCYCRDAMETVRYAEELTKNL